MTSQNEIRLALVVDSADSYDGSSVQIVDLTSLIPIGNHTYIIRTKPFDDSKLENGAGEFIPRNEIYNLIQKAK